jgi:superfamily II DNA or RNA helicase
MGTDSLKAHKWQRFIEGPDNQLVEELYEPGLSLATHYDRSCAYFSSSVLSAAARGFSPFIERLISLGDKAPKPAIRLLVNEELSEADAIALQAKNDYSILERALKKRLKTPQTVLEKNRLQMLGWLVREGFLDLRVGIMRKTSGIVHAKFGLITDSNGDTIVFAGSGNESAQGLLANYEELEVSGSWADQDRYDNFRGKFEALWSDQHQAVRTYTLPEALRLKLIKLAPEDPPIQKLSQEMERQKLAMTVEFMLAAPFSKNGGATIDALAPVKSFWPHQIQVVKDTAEAWPQGRLLCDEVGMGKTIEAIGAIRRLLAGQGVSRILFLVPAGLLKQWQEELREKGGLSIPYHEGNYLVNPDGKKCKAGFKEALSENLVIMSRETARMESNRVAIKHGVAWDLVLMDEAHAARRRGGETEFNKANLLLDLLRIICNPEVAKSIMLLSATPMQINPWEPWDLLDVLGEGGYWLADFVGVRSYFESLHKIRANDLVMPQEARKTANLIDQDPDFPVFEGRHFTNAAEIKSFLEVIPPHYVGQVGDWLSSGAPLHRRMHRNTRETLRYYFANGLLDSEPPMRDPNDYRYDYRDDQERAVYSSIKNYIDARFQDLENHKSGKGFVMTVYRRRAVSSPYALKCSLLKRRKMLGEYVRTKAVYTFVDPEEFPQWMFEEELPDFVSETGKVDPGLPESTKAAKSELDQIESLLAQLEELGAVDTKRDHFLEQLKKLANEGRPVLVFTEYVDTMHYLRDFLKLSFESGLACYHGGGGEVLSGGKWVIVGKSDITDRLFSSRIKVLLCTDAASEGLNLQAAGALINYDLPWNPSKVEQRIGRIDRIGQKYSKLPILNFFLRDSVDDRVYTVLRKRCNLFEQYVGEMQPVLARARKMILDDDTTALTELDEMANVQKSDELAKQTFARKDSLPKASIPPQYQLRDFVETLIASEAHSSFTIKRSDGVLTIGKKGRKKVSIGLQSDALERDPKLEVMNLQANVFAELRSQLGRPAEQLPLVLGEFEKDQFKATVLFWIGGSKRIRIKDLKQLNSLLAKWNGEFPSRGAWISGDKAARKEAEKIVELRMSRFQAENVKKLNLRLEAAKIRLKRELGRFLIANGASPTPLALNKKINELLIKDSETQRRVSRCLDKYEGQAPGWGDYILWELGQWNLELTTERRKGMITGKELEAALNDPRWIVLNP